MQPDVAPLPLLNAWHIPTSAEPATLTMRHPRFPIAGSDAKVYFGIQPNGLVKGAKLHWQWSKGLPQVAVFTFDSLAGSVAYWRAQFPMPARPVGTFRYTIEIEPADSTQYSTTWLFGDDAVSNKTATASIAAAAPYKPDVRLPVVGEIVITEAMVNALGPTPEAEWFEAFNAAPVPLTLHACLVGDQTGTAALSDPELILWPGVYAVFANTPNSTSLGGFTPDFNYGSALAFSNVGDQIRVLLPDLTTVVDQVTYGGAGWVNAQFATDGHSMQYNVLLPNSTDNDTGASWCASQKPYGAGTSFGTPQAPTDGCLP